MDASFVLRTDTSFTPTNLVPGWNFRLSGWTSSPPAGTTLWARGDTSGNMTGLVRAINVTLRCDCCRTTTTGMIRAGFRSQGGDSGGVVAAGTSSPNHRFIAGIISGGDSVNTYIVPIVRILNRFDVSSTAFNVGPYWP